jgi:hypothetical protein
MKRREAVKTATVLVGGVLLASNGMLVACSRDQNITAGKVLSVDDQAMIQEIADTLFPTTLSSPGARAAGAGATINLLLTDCYAPADQQRVVNGMKEFRQTCVKGCGGNFSAASQDARERLLQAIDAEAQKNPEHYFNLIRELSHQAYFTSEVGMTKARRYIMTPGKWIGCMPMRPGQRQWA